MSTNSYNYLQLNDRLSQIWLNKYTLILILAAFKLFLFSFSLKHSLNTAQDYVLANCSTLDKLYVEIIEDSPYYIAKFGNYMVKESMDQSVRASLMVLKLLVTSSESLLEFLFDFYLGTYECLLFSAIDGSVDIATNATEKLLSFVNDSISTVADELDDGLDDLSKIINKLISVTNKVEDFFTGDDDEEDGDSNITKVNLTISSLRNLYIPSSINDKLEEISGKTPSFATVKNKTHTLISKPFEKVKDEISSINVSKVVGNPQILFVPDKFNGNSSSPGICSSNKEEIVSFFKSTDSLVKTLLIIFFVLLIVAAIAMMLPEWWEERMLWNKLHKLKHLQTNMGHNDTDLSSSDEETANPFEDKYILTKDVSSSKNEDIIYSYFTCFNPWSSRLSNFITSFSPRFNSSPVSKTIESQKPYLRWTILYITSERALLVLGIGIIGLLVCIIQIITISVLQSKLNEFENNSTVFSANLNMNPEFDRNLQLWGNQTNIYINSTQNNLNEQVFGWVESTTESLNNTVTEMIDDIDETLADLFNGTLLYHPMKSVVSCVIEDKLYKMSKALTWVNEKAEVKLPQVNTTEIKQAVTSSNSTGSANEILQSVKTDTLNFIKEIIKMYSHSVKIEITIVCAIIGIWLIQIPIALIIIYLK